MSLRYTGCAKRRCSNASASSSAARADASTSAFDVALVDDERRGDAHGDRGVVADQQLVVGVALGGERRGDARQAVGRERGAALGRRSSGGSRGARRSRPRSRGTSRPRRPSARCPRSRAARPRGRRCAPCRARPSRALASVSRVGAAVGGEQVGHALDAGRPVEQRRQLAGADAAGEADALPVVGDDVLPPARRPRAGDAVAEAHASACRRRRCRVTYTASVGCAPYSVGTSVHRTPLTSSESDDATPPGRRARHVGHAASSSARSAGTRCDASPSPTISLRTVSPWLAGATLPSSTAVAASSASGASSVERRGDDRCAARSRGSCGSTIRRSSHRRVAVAHRTPAAIGEVARRALRRRASGRNRS